MRSGLELCVLGLLCLHSSVFGQEATDVQPGVLIFCDDPSVEKAAHSAVHKINEGLTSDNKLALYQILTARKSETGSDSVYSLQFTSRRTDCPAGDSKPWTDCDYLPVNKEPISCNATVRIMENETDTTQVFCQFDDHIIPEKAPCMGCPVEIDENSEDLKVPLSFSIAMYNSMSDSTHLFTLHNVGHTTRQVVAGFRFKLRFGMRRTTCAKAEHKDLHDLCVPDEENVEYVSCNSTVDLAPWRHENPQGHIECEPADLPTQFSMRRPPGWSPLRHFLISVPSPASPSHKPTLTKEESSEEDTTASNPSASSDAVTDSPFHCPSKPWKAFNPPTQAVPEAPTAAAADAASPLPPADGAFSDKDLLA